MTDENKPASHRWSGWPGAWCLDCGAEDPYEQALADGKIDFADVSFDIILSDDVKAELAEKMVCPEPGSNRCNPYHKRQQNDD